MADPPVLYALKDKIYELRQAIVSYEDMLERSRKELAVMTAAVTIFHRDGGRIGDSRPANARNLFKRGEVGQICRAALSVEPDGMTTRDLAVACLAAREFDHEDPVLVRAMVGLISNTLKKAVRRRELVCVQLGQRTVKWRLATDDDLAITEFQNVRP